MPQYVTAKEAATRLGVSLATIYSYVSRGLIRSIPADERARTHQYDLRDIEQLLTRKEAGRNPENFAKTTLHWGTPVLDSAITLIKDGNLYYRGQDAVELAFTATFEAVVCMLWQAHDIFVPANLLDSRADFVPKGVPALTQIQIALAQAMQNDLAAYDLQGLARTGVRILRLMTDTIGAESTSIPQALADAWQTDAAFLNTALILCADHELNASSFTARIAAGAGANPYAVVLASLATLTGFRHGGATERAAAFWQDVLQLGDAQQVVFNRLKRGESLPGFGHRMYPEGDPRGAALLQTLAETHHPSYEMAQTLIEVVAESTQLKPNIDFGLVLLAEVLKLPEEAPLLLFAIGRTAGWLAHASEQYQDAQLIRPRARYIGMPPHSKDSSATTGK